MSRTQERRSRTASALSALACGVAPVSFDSRSGSYGVGKLDGSGYFTPTFPSEHALLDWAGSNIKRIERFVRRAEPIEPHDFVEKLLKDAYALSGDDGEAFAAALSPRMHELISDAKLIGERDLDMILDEIEGCDRPPSEILRSASEVLSFEFEGPAPRPA